MVPPFAFAHGLSTFIPIFKKELGLYAVDIVAIILTFHNHDNNSLWSKSQIFSSKIFSKYFQLAAGLVGWYANASPPALL